MDLPRLSVIIPNYNHGAYLPTSLNAVLRQSVSPLEVIVVDDGSTDNSVEVLEQFARQHSNLWYLKHEKNLGAVAAVETGIKAARGDYMLFASADDEVVPGFLEASLRLLARHPEAALSCTASEWLDVGSGLKWHMAADMASRPCYLSPDELVRLGRKRKLCICANSVILKKTALLEMGGFSADLHWHADWLVDIIPALRYGICYVPELLTKVNLYTSSYYHRGRNSPEHIHVLDRLLARLISPQFADVAPRVRDSAALALFEFPLLRLVLQKPEYRYFLTPRLLVLCVCRNAEVVGQKILPRPLARLFLRLLYQRKRG
jgi:glycosyltransferase involved in cell wall biosynthesis